MKKKIFIIGTGRSGTHWMGHIVESVPEIKTNIEKWPIFKLVTQAAVNYKKRKIILPFIILYYKLINSFTNKHFADKSHPNIWLMEYLMKFIPNSYFLGIIRNPHPTVSSMLLHKNVLRWITDWQKYPIPNEFLGITTENVEQYKKMPVEAKCTMRWISHKKRFEELEMKYPDRLLLIDYEKLFENAEEQLKRIQTFLQLQNNIPLPPIKEESKYKWRKNLNSEQIEIINNTLRNNGYSNFIAT